MRRSIGEESLRANRQDRLLVSASVWRSAAAFLLLVSSTAGCEPRSTELQEEEAAEAAPAKSSLTPKSPNEGEKAGSAGDLPNGDGSEDGGAKDPGQDGATKTGDPAFVGEARPLPEEVRAHMTDRSWREGCPVELGELSLLTVSHWDMNGEVAAGELVVASRVSDRVLRAFELLFERRFPIEKMRRIAHYDGDDDRSMADNNTSAFNCRRVAGTTRWSEHSYGTAVDINPVQNPYVREDYVAPKAGIEFLDRSDLRPGMVERSAVAAFDEIGFGWGGRWRSAKDYQHFSESGR